MYIMSNHTKMKYQFARAKVRQAPRRRKRERCPALFPFRLVFDNGFWFFGTTPFISLQRIWFRQQGPTCPASLRSEDLYFPKTLPYFVIFLHSPSQHEDLLPHQEMNGITSLKEMETPGLYPLCRFREQLSYTPPPVRVSSRMSRLPMTTSKAVAWVQHHVTSSYRRERFALYLFRTVRQMQLRR